MARPITADADRALAEILKAIEPKIAAATGEELLALLEQANEMRAAIAVGVESRRKGGQQGGWKTGLKRLRESYKHKPYTGALSD